MDLGIVIVNYNTCALLRRCLETVFASTGATFEVCVVDNNSPDDSVMMVATEFPQVRLIANRENVGYPAANNIGLRTFGFEQGNCDGAPRYALLLNPDTEVPPDAFAQMLAFADAHSEAGVFGPKLVRPDGSLDKACRRSFPTPAVSALHMLGLWRLFPKSRLFGRYNLTYLDPDQVAEVDAVVGAFMMVRRESIVQAGLLDDTFFMYGEDLDWAFRIKEAGWSTFYYPGVTVLHVKRAASRHSARAQVEFWRAMDIFYRKHYAAGTARWLHYVIVSAIALRKKLVEWQVKRRA
ncbi:MAG: glycosyltransferase family 2 protein [Anaerolineae bacterium]|nr:glycosyltransferase family 2 protein [Anaerolineae bacterium]